MERELLIRDLFDVALEHGEDIPVMFSVDGGETYECVSRASAEEGGLYIGAKSFFAEPMTLGDVLAIAADCTPSMPVIVHKSADDFGGAVYAVAPDILEEASLDPDGVLYLW